MEAEAAKFIGAGLAVIALAGVGIGIGNIFSSLVSSIAIGIFDFIHLMLILIFFEL